MTQPAPAADGSGPVDGPSSAVRFDERLWPNFWVWLIAAGTAAAVVIVLAPISITAGIIGAIVAAILLVVLLIASTPRITVTDTMLQVGRAQIERRFVGQVEAFTGEAATEQRGTKLNGTAYMCLRGWIDPVVTIQITDETDLTPYWITSTRRPQQLAAALGNPGQDAA
jgi:membrane protein implicated in regulation of membrane protease activity